MPKYLPVILLSQQCSKYKDTKKEYLKNLNSKKKSFLVTTRATVNIVIRECSYMGKGGLPVER